VTANEVRTAGQGHSGRYVDVGDVALYVEEHGSGQPLLLIHGGLGSGAEWAPLLDGLTDEFRVITPDTRGHGRSVDVGHGLSYAGIADDVAALIRALDLQNPIVGGWSDGGQATIELGVRHPGVAAGLVVGGAYPEFVRSGLRETHRALLGADDAGVPDLERLAAELGDDAGEIRSLHPGGEDQWRALIHHTAPMWLGYRGLTTAELQAIQVPVLVVAGDRDEFIPLDLSVALYRALPDAELAVCPRADHAAPFTAERGNAFTQVIADFVRRQARSLA
jgi:pimeloyl-ACP methyl ester carboxylesterase